MSALGKLLAGLRAWLTHTAPPAVEACDWCGLNACDRDLYPVRLPDVQRHPGGTVWRGPVMIVCAPCRDMLVSAHGANLLGRQS